MRRMKRCLVLGLWPLLQTACTCRALLVVSPSPLANLPRRGVSSSLRQDGRSRRHPFTAATRPVWLFGNAPNKDVPIKDEEEDDDMFSLDKFQKAKDKIAVDHKIPDDDDFDGYQFRDVILEKWGKCFDVDFNKVDTLGIRSLYLNVMPFYLGKRPFRHKTELDYLCHLQAVVEILQEYNQLGYVLQQIQETQKKPRPGTSPLVAVPLRLDLTPEQVKQILNY
eukprot:scaffold18346_cov145-Amphora_coffeaeformis.AAC.2